MGRFPTRALLVAAALLVGVCAETSLAQQVPATPRNVVFILSDDHRYDFMGFMEGAPDFLDTPNMDRMATGGAHLANAFVSTALCSPSRASILTGQYAHTHGLTDNHHDIRPGTVFFPQYLQETGYRTAFFGKWHMGDDQDYPRPGFDQWVSFRGQGVYTDPLLNVNGTHRQETGHTTDLLTDYALDWMKDQQGRQPFFVYLSHKAVHAPFEPTPRHAGTYADVDIPYPATLADVVDNYRGKPDWLREARFGSSGVEYMFEGVYDLDLEKLYRRYSETLLDVDDSVGRVLDFLEQNGLAENTLVIYMGDNGFALGEHGLIDKRHAYEESIRVPMLAWAPGTIRPGTRIDALVQNIDVAPTVLDFAGHALPGNMEGASFLPMLYGRQIPWRDALLYEYYWEWNNPETPTVFSLRTDRYKYIFYHGIWDQDELYDLETDPAEAHNLARIPAYRDRVLDMRARLFGRLRDTGGLSIPLAPPVGIPSDGKKNH